jgi:nucleoside-diphosphate-sugar epimerase
LHNDEQPIIFGDGIQTRDFVHVSDIVSANMLALKSKEAVGEAINVASGISITINELAKILSQIAGKEKLKPIFAEPRLGDIQHCSADISKAEQLLKFHPKVMLKEGLSSLIKVES